MTAGPRLVVAGLPVTQGSKTAFVNKATGRAQVTEQRSKALKDWRQAIAAEARAWKRDHPSPPLEGPLVVRLDFYVQRPKSAPKTRRTWPTVKGSDVDKLARAALDAMTKILYRDDAQIVDLRVWKDYEKPDGFVGVRIDLDEIEAP